MTKTKQILWLIFIALIPTFIAIAYNLFSTDSNLFKAIIDSLKVRRADYIWLGLAIVANLKLEKKVFSIILAFIPFISFVSILIFTYFVGKLMFPHS